MKKDGYKFLVFALAFVYIVFGALKVVDRSPISDLVVATFPFMSNRILFALFGLFEVTAGLALLFPRTRKIAAAVIALHLLSTFLTLVLASSHIFSAATVVTLEGEFVFKNVILISVAYYIFKSEGEVM